MQNEQRAPTILREEPVLERVDATRELVEPRLSRSLLQPEPIGRVTRCQPGRRARSNEEAVDAASGHHRLSREWPTGLLPSRVRPRSEPGSPEATGSSSGSSDLTTHGVVVGMTGSGKTGLAVCLIEEALLAGIPALVLDPKGDMGNLALVFPDLQPASFRPWVSEAERRPRASRSTSTPRAQATVWREGLERSGIGPERLQALRDAADVTVYTPGSTAGVPLNGSARCARPTSRGRRTPRLSATGSRAP